MFPFRMMFFYLVNTCWIFYISLLYENSINQISQCYREKKEEKTSNRKDAVNVRFPRKHFEREKAGVNRRYQQQSHHEYDMTLMHTK